MRPLPLSLVLGDEAKERCWRAQAPSRGLGRWMYCKYCDKNVRPLALIEDERDFAPELPDPQLTRMAVCSACGYGLTPPTPIV